MTIYRTRRGARNYGFAVGILQLDCSLPFIPGDVDNATTYDYPVIYRAIPGLSTASCLRGAPEMAGELGGRAAESGRAGASRRAGRDRQRARVCLDPVSG